jgi:hypothetical protein
MPSAPDAAPGADATALPCCAIIPAFDEARRVGFVVEACLAAQLFSSIVVVDDGSSDGTAGAAETAGATVIRQQSNAGKARAMGAGLEATTEPIVCFLDADLLAITTHHLNHLVRPVALGWTPAQLAVFKGGRIATSFAQKIAPMISGQRCLRRELLRTFEGWDSGFGIETALNAHLLKLGVQQQVVEWQGAAQVMKEEKRGLVRGLRARLGMYREIAVAWLRSKRGG